MKNAIDITIVLDRSGSMQSIAADTIGGFNTFVGDQQKVVGECVLTLIQFDTQEPYEVVYNAVPIADVKPLTAATFVPRGGTPLYDALGGAMTETGRRLAALPEADRPVTVLFIIITDGEENSSREYHAATISQMVEKQRTEFSWQFIYLGANQDSILVAKRMNIPTANAMNYAANPAGVASTYTSMSDNVVRTRSMSMSAKSATGVSSALGFDDKQRVAALANADAVPAKAP